MAHEAAKRAAAKAACGWVESDTVLGLGTGSTALFVIERVAEMMQCGLELVCVPTSEATSAEAERRGLTLARLEDVDRVDLVIDGADEVDTDFNLIKGGGGALTREKLVALAAHERICVVDETKMVEQLGLAFRLPVEILPFGWKQTLSRLRAFGDPTLRQVGDDSGPSVTDNGNHIVDLAIPGGIDSGDAARLDRDIRTQPGVLETGLFVGLVTRVIVGRDDRSTKVLESRH